MDDSITLEVLKDIREELRVTRETLSGGLDGVREELHAAREQLTDRIERVERRQTESEIRIATEIVGVASAISQVRDLLRDTLRTQLHDHERRITALEKKNG